MDVAHTTRTVAIFLQFILRKRRFKAYPAFHGRVDLILFRFLCLLFTFHYPHYVFAFANSNLIPIYESFGTPPDLLPQLMTRLREHGSNLIVLEEKIIGFLIPEDL